MFGGAEEKNQNGINHRSWKIFNSLSNIYGTDTLISPGTTILGERGVHHSCSTTHS